METKAKVYTEIWYAAIRCTEGHEWIDKESMACSQAQAQTLSIALDQRIREWASENPVIRISKVRIEEIE